MNLKNLTLDELTNELSESHEFLDTTEIKKLQKLRKRTEFVQSQITTRLQLDELNELQRGLDKLVEKIDYILAVNGATLDEEK